MKICPRVAKKGCLISASIDSPLAIALRLQCSRLRYYPAPRGPYWISKQGNECNEM